MQNIKALKQVLADKGFPHIFEWHDEPGTEYPVHAHKGAVAFYILDGGLSMWIGGEEKVFTKGDYFDVPVGAKHSAKVGSEGVHFLVGEMIEGDS
jgi:quercetin dioxygenase-like cupin family protein